MKQRNLKNQENISVPSTVQPKADKAAPKIVACNGPKKLGGWGRFKKAAIGDPSPPPPSTQTATTAAPTLPTTSPSSVTTTPPCVLISTTDSDPMLPVAVANGLNGVEKNSVVGSCANEVVVTSTTLSRTKRIPTAELLKVVDNTTVSVTNSSLDSGKVYHFDPIF